MDRVLLPIYVNCFTRRPLSVCLPSSLLFSPQSVSVPLLTVPLATHKHTDCKQRPASVCGVPIRISLHIYTHTPATLRFSTRVCVRDLELRQPKNKMPRNWLFLFKKQQPFWLISEATCFRNTINNKCCLFITRLWLSIA